MQKSCLSCEALAGSFGDSYDWIEERVAANPALGEPRAGDAWMAQLAEEMPHLFDADYRAPHACEAESEEYYVLDVVMQLLHQANHPPFAPPPAWLPLPLLRAAIVLAKAQVLAAEDESEKTIFSFVHDRLVPRNQWLIGDTDYAREVQALGMTSAQMRVLVEQVFAPTLMPLTWRRDVLDSLCTCA